MNLTSEQIEGLMRLVGITRDDELNCSECLDRVAELVEYELVGAPVPGAFAPVLHHLAICPECREEYEALAQAMRDLSEDGDRGS